MNESFQIMRGKTIECISLIGLAVGKEKFEADAAEVSSERVARSHRVWPVAKFPLSR